MPPPRSQNAWDAKLYDAKHSFVWKEVDSLLELLAPRAGERILDLGCGTGHLTARIAAAGAEVIGIDSSADMIAAGREHFPRLQFEVADAREFSFPRPFDAVFSNAALHWIVEAESVIRCVQRTLRPGGRFVVEFGGRGNVANILEALSNAASRMELEPFRSPWYFPSIPEYCFILEKNGFEVTLATLFDRPTRLDGEDGMRSWIQMFGAGVLSGVPAARQDDFLGQVEEELRPILYRNGSWFADYRRLRVVAYRA
jgi:trans-aconitate methyltransferase